VAKAKLVTVKLDLASDMAFRATFETGHEMTFDAADTVGGKNAGPRPTHMLLASLGACTAMDVISILHKMREPVVDYRLTIEGVRAPDHPQIFTHITITHVITGDIDEQHLARAIELSDMKYCSIGAMLRRSAQIDTTFRIEPPQT